MGKEELQKALSGEEKQSKINIEEKEVIPRTSSMTSLGALLSSALSNSPIFSALSYNPSFSST